MMKSRMALLIAALLIASIFSSCMSKFPAVEQPSEQVTIRFMHLWPAANSAQQSRIVNRIVQEYQAEYPHVTIKVDVLENESYKEKLKILSASNRLPDVGVTWAAGFLEPYVIGKRFAVLDDLLENGQENEFVPGTTEAYAVGGKVYALPLEFNIAPVFYNKRIFAEHGLSKPETYEDFKHVVETLANNGVTPIALGNRDRWPGSLWYMYLGDRYAGASAIRDAVERNSRFNVPGLVEAARQIQVLVDMNAFNKGFNGISAEEAKTAFINGRAAMYLMGTWELPNLIMSPGVPEEFKGNVGYFKFPLIVEGKSDINSWVGGPGVGLFVAEDSKVKEEAKQFVRYFVEKWGEVAVKDAGIMPATKVDTANTDLPPIYIDLLAELYTASNLTLYLDVALKPGASELHLNMIQALYGKAVTPEEFANEHEAALERGE